MFFKAIDKFFYQLRQLLSVVIFILIALSCIYFIYWLIFNANVKLPDFLTAVLWSVIDFFAMSIKHKPLYNDMLPVLPIMTCGIFILLTYIANCLMILLENNHRFFRNCVDAYKDNLAKTINAELHNDFINELKRTAYMLVKIRISAVHHTSYLTAVTDGNINTQEIEKSVERQILETMDSKLIDNKGMDDRCVYFLLTNFSESKRFLSDLVSRSSTLIKKQIRPKLDINFYCAVDLFNDLSEFTEKSNYLNKVLNLKIENKIAATPRTKVYFENILPSEYQFGVQGEYNLSSNPDKAKNVMIYSMRRKN